MSGICNQACLSVPSSTFNEEAVNVDTVLGLGVDFIRSLILKDLKGETESVNGNLVLSRMCLEHAGQETLREEHVRQAEGSWIAVLEPGLHEVDSLDHVRVPGAKWLQ